LERYLVGDAGRYQTILPGKHRVLAAGQLWQNEAKKGNVFKVDKTQTWLPAPGRLTGISFDTEAWRPILPEILQMNPKPASMFAFSRPSCKTDARC